MKIFRKNYGMAVPYKKSELYRKNIDYLDTHDKRHLRKMISNEIDPLEFALRFVNQDYGTFKT